MNKTQALTSFYAGMTHLALLALLAMGVHHAITGEYLWAILDGMVSIVGFKLHGWCESGYEHY